MFPKEFSFGRAADVYLIKTPCLAKRFQLVLSKAAAFAVLSSRWPTGKHHAEARRPPQLLCRLRISSERANVVRFAPESGQIAHVSICLLSANSDRMQRSKIRRSEEHTSELQSLRHLVCRLLLEKKT